MLHHQRSFRSPLLLLLIAVASLLPACGRASRADRDRRLQGVVLIVLDTLRADRLGCYGNPRATSPAIDRLAADGVLFEDAVSFAPWTLPSIAALLSGEPAPRVFDQRLQRSLVASIRAAGYRTAAITEGGFVSRRFGLDLGFDEFTEEEGAVRLLTDAAAAGAAGSGGIANTFARAAKWLGEQGDQPFFLLVHTYEPHAPYTRTEFTAGLAPGAVGRTFRIEQLAALRAGRVRFTDRDLHYLTALYDGGVRECDRQVAALQDAIAEAGLADDVALVITSDHGEELGQHYRQRAGDHGHSLYDDLLHVPLILRDPRGCFAAGRIDRQVRTLDVLPTIADLLGVAPGITEGRSLMPLLRGEAEERRIAFGGANKDGAPALFVRFLGYKYIQAVGPAPDDPSLLPLAPPRQLFDLAADPHETRNLVAERGDVVARFEQLVLRLNAADATPGSIGIPADLDAELTERLRSLGYVK